LHGCGEDADCAPVVRLAERLRRRQPQVAVAVTEQFCKKRRGPRMWL
jgi:hypothetical protein